MEINNVEDFAMLKFCPNCNVLTDMVVGTEADVSNDSGKDDEIVNTWCKCRTCGQYFLMY